VGVTTVEVVAVVAWEAGVVVVVGRADKLEAGAEEEEEEEEAALLHLPKPDWQPVPQ